MNLRRGIALALLGFIPHHIQSLRLTESLPKANYYLNNQASSHPEPQTPGRLPPQ